MNGLGSIPLWKFPFATDHCCEFAMAGTQHAQRWKRTHGYTSQQDWTGLKLPFQQLSAALATKLKCYAAMDATWAHQRRLQFMSRIWWRHPHLLASVYCCEALPGHYFLLAWHPYSWSIMSLNWTGLNLMLPQPQPYMSFYSLTLLLGYTQIVPTTHLLRYHTLTAFHSLVIHYLWRQSSHCSHSVIYVCAWCVLFNESHACGGCDASLMILPSTSHCVSQQHSVSLTLWVYDPYIQWKVSLD